MEEAWKKLLSSLLPKRAKNFNGERVQAKETEAGDVIGRLATTPMFGGRSLIMVDNVEAWGKEDRAAMEAFVQRIPPSACLVMTASDRKTIEGLAKAVETKGKVVQFRSPGDKEALRWLIDRGGQDSGKFFPTVPRSSWLRWSEAICMLSHRVRQDLHLRWGTRSDRN